MKCLISFLFLSIILTSSELCKNGQTWQELHINPRSYVSLPLTGIGSNFYLLCLSGYIWDLASGHPKLTLELYQGPKRIADLTAKVNNTGPGLYFNGSSDVSQWSLVATNNNLLWNADITLVVSYYVQHRLPNCKTCPDSTKTGLFCNQSCSANCYTCCQNSSSQCLICANGRSGEPQCDFSCRSDCLFCDDLNGCHLCKDFGRSGPTCNQCRPLACAQPDFLNCVCPSKEYERFCEACKTAVEKAESLALILSKYFNSVEEARVNIAVAEEVCLAVTEVFTLICDIAVFTIAEAGEQAGKWVIKYIFSEVVKNELAKIACEKIHMCP